MAGKKGCVVCPKDLAKALDEAYSKNALIDLLYTVVSSNRGWGGPEKEEVAYFLQCTFFSGEFVSQARGEKVNLTSVYDKVHRNRVNTEKYKAALKGS